MRAALALFALLLGCTPSAPAASPQDLQLACALHLASRDFLCPIDQITIGPCVCSGAIVLNACGASATYEYSDDGTSCDLIFAALPRPKKRDELPPPSTHP